MLLNRFFAPIATAVFLTAPVAVYAQTPPWALPSATERYARANDTQVPYYDARRTAYDQGYREGVVFLHMRGACSGCPSSTATLRHGIENLLRHFIPEVQEVRPV